MYAIYTAYVYVRRITIWWCSVTYSLVYFLAVGLKVIQCPRGQKASINHLVQPMLQVNPQCTRLLGWYTASKHTLDIYTVMKIRLATKPNMSREQRIEPFMSRLRDSPSRDNEGFIRDAPVSHARLWSCMRDGQNAIESCYVPTQFLI